MENSNNNIMEELSSKELQSINGGFLIAFAGLLIAGFALGYQIGKSAAERARVE